MTIEQLEELAMRDLNREFCNIGHFMLGRALEAAYRRGAADTAALANRSVEPKLAPGRLPWDCWYVSGRDPGPAAVLHTRLAGVAASCSTLATAKLIRDALNTVHARADVGGLSTPTSRAQP